MDRAAAGRRRPGDLASVVRPDSRTAPRPDDAGMSDGHRHCRVEEVFGEHACSPDACAFVERCALKHVEAEEEEAVFDALVEMRLTVELLRS